MDVFASANKALRQLLIARGIESRSATVDGREVHHYFERGEGSGPPVLLLHGLGGSANGFYKTFGPLKAAFREVWALDLPGNGFSPLPSSGPLPLLEQVQLVHRFVEQVVRAPVFLVGNSLGGAMALALAAEHPQSARLLGLVSPAGGHASPPQMSALIDSIRLGSQSRPAARLLTHRLFHRTPFAMRIFAGELQTMYATPAVQGILDEVGEGDFLTASMLSGLQMPTLLVWGRSEKLLPYEGLSYFRAHLPAAATIREVPGFGHIPQMERPRQLVAMLIDFARAHLT